jgi:GNAT superfamily N-acetyltransferase
MLPPKISLIARIAKPSDYNLIARLCRRTVGSGDYVLRILGETIAEKGLFLAWSNGKLVGMVNFERCIDGSGWLGMGRTDPEWRRRGVALFLQEQITVHARRNGIRYLRLWILSNNRPSLLAAMKGGFRPVCEAMHVSGSMQVKRSVEQSGLLASTSSKSLKSLLTSAYLSKMNGYFAYKWHFVKATEKLLKRLAERGELYSDGKTSFILTKPEIAFGHRYSSFALLDGSAASNLRQVKKIAKGYGDVILGSYLPYDQHLLSAARRTGFRRDSWGKHCIVFEKKI